jgi:hypothetical protein
MATFFARFLLPFGRPRSRLSHGLEDSSKIPFRYVMLAMEFLVPFIRRSNRYLGFHSFPVQIGIWGTRSERVNWDMCGNGPCAVGSTVISFLREPLAELTQAVGPIRSPDDLRPFPRRNIRLPPNAQSFSAILHIYKYLRRG